MSGSFTRTSLGDFPRVFSTKSGKTMRLQIFKENLHQALIEAYVAFQPRNLFRELPPQDDKEFVKWVEEMIGRGINLLAVSTDSGIVGHTSLLPIDDRRCEMIVAVWPQFQHIGIGTELVRGCLQMACELGFDQMSLPLAAADLRARHIATKCGFKSSKRWSRESKVICDLRRQRANQKKAILHAENRVIPLSHLNLSFDPMPISEQTTS